jgi:tetratricopeptide (TPR) repeat protein
MPIAAADETGMATNSGQNVSGAALSRGWQNLDKDAQSARRLAEEMLGAAPENEDAALLLAAARRRLGDIEGARAVLAPIMSGTAASPIAWFEWGMILCETRDEADAVAPLQNAVRLAPSFTGAWRGLGDVLMVLGAGVAAGEAYAGAARASVQDPKLAAAAADLTDGRPASAETRLKALVRQFPTDVRAHYLLAEAAMRVGRAREAEAVLLHCLGAAPGFAAARHSLAVLLYAQRKFGAAIPHLTQLLDILPHQPCLRTLLSVCYVETGDFAAAVKLYEAKLSAFRDRPKVWLSYGHALKTLGRGDEAADAYRASLALAPPWPAGLYLSLADLKTVPFTDSEIAAMRALAGSQTTAPADAAQLHYALGRALEQRGLYEEAFTHFAQGAAFRRGTITYDAQTTTGFVAATRSALTAAFFAARRGVGCPSDAPIFIVGLPRSGSTLVEQILASHPGVEGTSELKEIGLIAEAVRAGRPEAALPDAIAALDSATLTRLGERYIYNTRQFRHTAKPHFIDKMPDNFLHVGLIHLILPRARIIDVRRGAMASGLAAFKQHFQAQQSGQDYTYDLTEIGRYYRDYVALMAHFDAVLPGLVYRVHYEALVTDTEAQIRALLDYCGLLFEPACLRYWETDRAVQTPSAQQVRRPIFREGLEAWRHYEAWLGPLREALGDLEHFQPN